MTNEAGRPDPDQLLAEIREQEEQDRRGRLKIFFGAAAGVGKTYAMLEAAQARKREGLDVVVGYVETHGRAETEALLPGLPVIPRRRVAYRGATLEEFDLDAALARRPQLILVDELAHTNAPGSRHAKRYQDVQELLAAGIDVYTTLNVQHLESLHDVVRQITGVAVRETVPDRILEEADEVELIDLTPDDLLQRLKEGKVYVPRQAERAVRHFFRRGNLTALRELALRRTADRVDEQMQTYMHDHAITGPWPAGERVMVCISPHPRSAQLVRAARRIAAGLRADWIAVFVETSDHYRLPESRRETIARSMKLAESLGGEPVTLPGRDAVEEILRYARARNVTKIVVGKPARSRWQEWIYGSILADLIRRSGNIDVLVITGDDGEGPAEPARPPRSPSVPWRDYLFSAGLTLLATGAAALMRPHFELTNIVMVYLVSVVVVALSRGLGPSIFASVLSVLAFDFFFVPPRLTLAVSDTQYLVTFAVMLVVAIVISGLTVRLREQGEAARQRERRTAALYALSREIAATRGMDKVLSLAVRHITDVFQADVAVLLPGEAGFAVRANNDGAWWLGDDEQAVARWVHEHGEMAGTGTDTLPGAGALYIPMRTTRGAIGVLRIRPHHLDRVLTPDRRRLLEAFAGLAAIAVERVQLAEEAQRAHLLDESEKLRTALLNSISHDLRTPLAAITGSATSLLEGDAVYDEATRREFATTIREEAERLNRLVGNLLDMTRLESGVLELSRDWCDLEDVVGTALERLDGALRTHPVTVDIPPGTPLAWADFALIEQVLVNLLDNAARYSPPGAEIEVSARVRNGSLAVSVADRGVGIPESDRGRVFEKFYRVQRGEGRSGGTGLGLSICKGIVEAHGGRIWAEPREGGGTVLAFTLPLHAAPAAAEGTERGTR